MSQDNEAPGKPPTPTLKWVEADRLAALDRYAILDTPREAEFDDVVRLAADVFEAPISVVNLIADSRQWFKAEVGIGADELPLDVSICAYAILQTGVFVVPDTTKDARFDCNPLVTGEPGLRFYAGALLVTPDGLPLGTVCVLDTKPRPAGITSRQRLTLEVLARQVMTQLELRRAVADRDRRADRLEAEIARAAVVDQALSESEERLRLAVDNAEIGFWDVDVVHDTLIWPPRTKAMFGISPDVPVTMQDFYEGLHPDDVTATSAVYAAAADPHQRTLYDVEYRTIGKEDRLVRWVAAKGRGIFDNGGRCLRVIGTAIEITERKRVEADLRASEARLRTLNADLEKRVVERATERALLWQISPDLLSVIDLATASFDRVNPAWELALGWTEAEMDAQPFERFLHPEDVGATIAAIEKVLVGNSVLRFENRYRTKAGHWRWMSWVAVSEGGKLYSTTRDITEDKAHAEALAIATAERDRMWQTSPDLLAVLGFDGVFRRVNPAWTDVLGYAENEILGTRFDRLVHSGDLEVTERALLEASGGPLQSVENRYRHKDGSYRWISWITPLPENGFIYATGRHITANKERQAELQAVQEALRQAQKMEAVGQLTGGIAHDFNNMLAVVIGSLDLLNRRIGVSDARAKRYVDAAADGARRAALLTQRLLAFSRQQPLEPEPIDGNKLVAGMSDLLRHSLGGDVRLETVLAGGLWRTHADPNQLESVILNLAINGRDAMANGGRLTIETANCHLDARYVAAHLGVPAGQYVMIAVTDTGSGMPPEVMAKAFDPFFTTKQVGKGTGLGLSQVYGFVKQSGGHVKIYSEVGQGTTIKVYLPRLIGAEAEFAADSSGDEMPLGENQEVVLVVEDEPAVRQFSVDALTELGYRVLEADGAAAALRLLDVHPEIALLFTDIVMPEVNGAKLADEARRRRPGLRVLFTTGYTRNAIVHNGVLDNGVELIGKPFTIEELAARVRAVIEATPQTAGVAFP